MEESPEQFKIRENRARRKAQRQGLKLVKSRRRDPQALGYGGYQLVDADNNIVAGELDTTAALTIDQVEAALNE